MFAKKTVGSLKKITILLLVIVSILSIYIIGGTNNKEVTETESTTETVKEIEYDSLQNMFIALAQETTEEQFKQIMIESGLPNEHTIFNSSDELRSDSSYIVAFVKESATHNRAKSGDKLTVDFDNKTGKLKYAEYYNEKAFRKALFYVYGTYWEFMEKAPGNYTGYYSYKPGDSEGGITIVYSNGNKRKTGYIPRTDAKDSINDAITERNK